MARTQLDSLQISDLAVLVQHLANQAVTTPKLEDQAVTGAKLGTGALIGTDIQPYHVELASLASLTVPGLLVKTGPGVHEAAAIFGTPGRVTVTNGDAVAGDPTIDLSTLTDSGTGSLVKISRDLYGRVSGTLAVTNTDLETVFGYVPEDSAHRGQANGFAPLDANSLIPNQYLPAIAITDTFVVGSQAAMLALNAQTGDVVIRPDVGLSYILQGADPSVLGNWIEILSPTAAVYSVNGQIGTVTLTSLDVAENGNLYYTNARARNALSASGGILYDSGSGGFSLDQDLTAIASLAGTSGFLKKTAADTWSLDSSIYLTANQTITLSGDVFGTGNTGITSTLATVGTPVTDSLVRITTDTKGRVTATSAMQSSDVSTALGYVPATKAVYSNVISAQSGTTQIPLDNTPPLITEGTQILNVNVSPISSSSRIHLNIAMMLASSQARTFIMALFRGSSLVCTAQQKAGSDPQLITFSYTDSPGTTNVQTYTMRVGLSGSGTWYVNQPSSAGQDLGATTAQSYTILDLV